MHTRQKPLLNSKVRITTMLKQMSRESLNGSKLGEALEDLLRHEILYFEATFLQSHHVCTLECKLE